LFGWKKNGKNVIKLAGICRRVYPPAFRDWGQRASNWPSCFSAL